MLVKASYKFTLRMGDGKRICAAALRGCIKLAVNTHRHNLLCYIRLEMGIMLTKPHESNPIGSHDYAYSMIYDAALT